MSPVRLVRLIEANVGRGLGRLARRVEEGRIAIRVDPRLALLAFEIPARGAIVERPGRRHQLQRRKPLRRADVDVLLRVREIQRSEQLPRRVGDVVERRAAPQRQVAPVVADGERTVECRAGPHGQRRRERGAEPPPEAAHRNCGSTSSANNCAGSNVSLPEELHDEHRAAEVDVLLHLLGTAFRGAGDGERALGVAHVAAEDLLCAIRHRPGAFGVRCDGDETLLAGRDARGVPADGVAMALEHIELVAERRLLAGQVVPDVRLAGDDLERHLLAGAADQDRHTAWRFRLADHVVGLHVGSVVGHLVLVAPHALQQLDSFRQLLQPFAGAEEWPAEVGEFARHPSPRLGPRSPARRRCCPPLR